MRRTMRTAGGIAALMFAIAGVVTLTPATPASAAAPEIVVSTDGTNFSTELNVNLFDSLDYIVPGDIVTGSLWVRNQASTSGIIRVAVSELDVSSPEFAASLTLSSELNGFTHAASLAGLEECQVIVQQQTIAAGATVRIDFNLLMSAATSGSTAQGENASLSFVVAAREWAAGPFTDDRQCSPTIVTPVEVPVLPNTGDNDGGLAWTGLSELGPTLLVALSLLGIGTLFAVLRRRRRSDETQES